MLHQIIPEITDFIFMEDEPVKADIILIPGSAHYEHVETAASLYHQGFSKMIMPCGKYSYSQGRFKKEETFGTQYEGEYNTEAAYFKHILMRNAVPRENIICEDRSTNTFENAMFAAQLIKDKEIDIKTALLCCQAFHARRAYMTFARYLPNVDIRVIPTVTQDISRDNWWKNEESFMRVMSELEKCGRFFNDMFPLIKEGT